MWSVSCFWDVVFVCVENNVCEVGICSVSEKVASVSVVNCVQLASYSS